MSQTKYLIIGSSHAGLSAMNAIRLQDKEGALTMITREKVLPYSPTILPYVVSGKTPQDGVFLRDDAYFEENHATFMKGREVTAIDTGANRVTLDSGEEITYEKLLIATGASPSVPPIQGLSDTSFHVLRTLEDAVSIRKAMKENLSAIILGAGLIGMHAAENLSEAGMEVTVLEMLPQVLPGYFDAEASGMIQKVFSDNGVRILTGNAVTHVTSSNNNKKVCVVSLENGLDLSAHLLVVATGVRANIAFLADSGVEADDGIVVGDTMRTSVDNVWAAGDVAKAGSFFGPEKILNGILPDAVEQGWIAGMDMVDDPALKPYGGGLSMNTYSFFGNRAFSVGMSGPVGDDEGFEVDVMVSSSSRRYQKLVFRDDHLVGASAINMDLDPGVLCRMIRDQIELGETRERFSCEPRDVGRSLMSAFWR